MNNYDQWIPARPDPYANQTQAPYYNDGTSRESLYASLFGNGQQNGQPPMWQDSTSAFGQGLLGVQGLANTYMGYQGLQESRRNNDRMYELATENNRREGVRYQNKVNEKKRNAGLLMGNSNNPLATARTVARTPYRGY